MNTPTALLAEMPYVNKFYITIKPGNGWIGVWGLFHSGGNNTIIPAQVHNAEQI